MFHTPHFPRYFVMLKRRNSTKGPLVIALTEALQANITSSEILQFNDSVVQTIQTSLRPNKNGRVGLAKLWRSFHVLRLSASTNKMWECCIKSCHLPDNIAAVSELTLQVILKRMMQSVIQELTSLPSSSAPPAQHLSHKELNVIRYIAGYVVLKMKRKFPLQTSFFDNIVSTTHNYISVETVEDYSRTWVEQVDRGGLYHVHDNLFNLLKEIEYVCCMHLDIRGIPSERLSEKIITEAMTCTAITGLWCDIASSVPTEHNTPMLKAIIKLWTNIRVHSFAKRWSDLLLSKSTTVHHSKALRRTLKQKGTDKDSTS
jgi:hypothetical protein